MKMVFTKLFYTYLAARIRGKTKMYPTIARAMAAIAPNIPPKIAPTRNRFTHWFVFEE